MTALVRFLTSLTTICVIGLVVLVPTVSAYADSEPVCIIKPDVNLRKGPGSDYAITWSVPIFMPFLKVERKGKWIKLRDLDGDVHWAHSSSVSHRTTCAVVKTKTARLRKEPGKNQPVAELSSVDRYTPFKKMDRDGEWVKVRDEFKGTYWVHENNIWIPMARSKVAF